MFDWYGPIAFIVTFFGIIGLMFLNVYCKVYGCFKRKFKKH